MTQKLLISFHAILAAVVGLLLIKQEVMATDWPQFRGPNRDGNWDETGILESFPREGLKTRWRRSQTE